MWVGYIASRLNAPRNLRAAANIGIMAWPVLHDPLANRFGSALVAKADLSGVVWIGCWCAEKTSQRYFERSSSTTRTHHHFLRHSEVTECAHQKFLKERQLPNSTTCFFQLFVVVSSIIAKSGCLLVDVVVSAENMKLQSYSTRRKKCMLDGKRSTTKKNYIWCAEANIMLAQ